MTVYVDDVRHEYYGRGRAIGMMRMVMCHMWADSLDELLAMVDKIGVQRKWLQQPPKASWVHLDISFSKKKLAIEAGAILTDKYGPLEHVAKLDIATGIPELIDRGQKRLEQIAKCRALPKKTEVIA